MRDLDDRQPNGGRYREAGIGDVKVPGKAGICIVNGVGHAFRSRAVARCGDNGVARLCYIAELGLCHTAQTTQQERQ